MGCGSDSSEVVDGASSSSLAWLSFGEAEWDGCDDGVGARAECSGEDEPALVMQNLLAAVERFDFGQQHGDLSSIAVVGKYEAHDRRNKAAVRAGEHA